MIRALVSIGTNSTRLLALDGDRRVAAESRGTRLGAGIGATGEIEPAARGRTLAAIEEYVELCRARHVEAIDAIATSALRRARDGAAFAAQVERLTGVAPRVLSGDEEASYSFLGATAGRDATHAVAVLDVGGGSTELAIDVPAHARDVHRVAFALSLEIGAVRLAERHRELLGARALSPADARRVEAQARADAGAVLARLASVDAFDALIAVGGTVFTAAGMLSSGTGYDGVRMTHAQREALVAALLERDLAERKRMPFIRPQRADILPAGLIVVDEACRLLNVDELVVSEADLLQGYLTSRAFRAIPFPPKR